MAVVYSNHTIDQLKGPYQGAPSASPLHLFRMSFNVVGTYATGGLNIDICQGFTGTAAQATGYGSRQGITSIQVITAFAFGDYNDGTNLLTVNNAALVLTNGGAVTSISAVSTGNLALVKLFTGVNGVGGAELTNATALSGYVNIAFLCNTTVGSLGLV